MDRSPIDELFNELFGYYPTKAGKAYELIVAAALKVITGEEITYDQHVKGLFSGTDYQLDGLIEKDDSSKTMVEAKDYTIDGDKVGRGDLQKLQGALTDLPVSGGIFASATDYTKPAQKYSDGSRLNPSNKPITLYHIRPSTELDLDGRVKRITIEMEVILPDFLRGDYKAYFTTASNELLRSNHVNIPSYRLDTFYDSKGKAHCSFYDFCLKNQPISASISDEYALGCWVLTSMFVKVGEALYELKGIDYKIPYTRTVYPFDIGNEGNHKLLIKSHDGSINKLLTDVELKKIMFSNGKVQQS